MTKEINMKTLKNLRSELLEIYEGFLKDPKDSSIHSRAVSYDREHGNLPEYNEILAKEPVPQEIDEAIRTLFKIYQYGDGIFDDSETIDSAKKIVKRLRELKEN